MAKEQQPPSGAPGSGLIKRDPRATQTLDEAQKNVQKKYDPDWDKVLYTPERVKKWLSGELTLQDLHAISGPEMLEMAIIGFSMYEQGKYEEAKVIFQGLNALDPMEGYYLTALGAVFLAQDELERALNCFNHAIERNPKEIASYVNRGEVYLRQGKILEAAQDFKKAVDLDPENKDPLSHRARILAAAALETLEAATREAKNKGIKDGVIEVEIGAKGVTAHVAGAKASGGASKPAQKPAAKPAAKDAGGKSGQKPAAKGGAAKKK